MVDRLEEKIQWRAYQIWERDGRPEGKQDDHWTRASACCTDIIKANQLLKMRTVLIYGMNPVNYLTFCPNKTATQNHSQTNTLF